MTSNTLLSKIKTKLILALIIVGLLCTSLLFLSACTDDTDSDLPSYSYTDTDDGLISNPNFNYNTTGIKIENFPQTSPSGWSRSKDSEGNSSSAKSGVIDISEEGWNAYLNSIYSDSTYLDYLENKLGFDKDDIEDKAKEENSEITSSELKEKVVAAYSSKLTAPALKEGATDYKVYALNNYTNKIGIGASQKIISSSTITLKKGEYVKITVDVLTQNIATTDSENNDVVLGLNGANDEFGASIRLVNNFNSESQADYAVTNINTNGAWKTYTVYAKGDSEFDSVITLALGLGYSDKYPTEGTVFFDNVTIEELETVSSLPTATTINYNETKAQTVNAGTQTSFFYDMTLTVDSTYYKSISPAITGSFTKNSNNLTSQDKGWTSTASFTGNKTVTVSNASYSLEVKDNANFKVEREQYAYVSFKLNNELSKLGSASITVDVYEGSDKKAAVATITETGETTVGIMIKNNFDKDDANFAAENERTFRLVIIIGPANISTADTLSSYASGTVEITDFKIAKGATYQYTDDTNETETPNYKFYSLFNSSAKGSTSLFAGYRSDFTASEEDTASTGFNVAATYNEYLNKQLVAPSEYDGVVTNHIYLTNSNDAVSTINTRLTGSNGSYAGVIDTKYSSLASYNKPANLPELDDDIRALMIYNKTADSYGFVSNKEAQVVPANTNAKITVSVKVDATAKAYIYLVETGSKEIMTFETFTPNSNGISSITGTEKVGEKLMFEVANTNDEWVDVTFYIATGKTEKSFRIELWNGSRDGASKSQGYVFFKSVDVSLSGAFTEPASFKQSFTDSASPLYALENSFSGENGEYLCYIRPLTETEKEFNEEYTDQAVSYSPKIVWAKSDTTIYSIFNTLDVEIVDPYDNIVEEESDDEASGCAAETDPAAFWLSFSSILLAAVLALAIVALIVKRVRHNRKMRAKEVKSHYTVKSRIRTAPKAIKPEQVKKEEKLEEIEPAENVEEAIEETAEVEEAEEAKEQTLDEYVYGEVQDFGESDDENK